MYSIVAIATAKHIINDFNSMKLSENSEFFIKEVVKTAVEAIDLHPDVIICPVKSETIDGIGLTIKIKESNIKTKVILYGRKTYESLKLAFDCGADGYLPLPAEKKEFDKLLEKFKNLFNKDKKTISDNMILDVNEKRVEFFNEILKDKLSQSDAYEKFFNLGIDLPYERISVSFVQFHIKNLEEFVNNNWKYGKDSLFTAIKNVLEKSNSKIYSVVLNYGEEEIYSVMLTENMPVSIYQLEDMKKNIKELMTLEVSYEFLAVYDNIEQFVKEENKKTIFYTLGIREVDLKISEIEEMEEAVVKAKDYINRKYMDEIGLSDVAETVGLSTAYFSRLFKQETGENFIDYLIKVRMEQAKKLLEDSTAQAKEIGESVGYKKGKYFGKLFKNYTGYTPIEYRAKVHRKK